MRVLIGCEVSGVVRRAFRALGHDAWSCDLLPAADGSPFHIVADHDLHLLDIAADWRGKRWNLGIFHPPCTRLCNSGVLRLYKGSKKAGGLDPDKLAEMREAACFWAACWNAPIASVCCENPVPHYHAGLPPWTQTVQPWQFGEPESKRTCLWLRGLPVLVPTRVLEFPACGHWRNQCFGGQNKLGPSPTRAADRARTYEGIATAMAVQWGRAD
ncbi:MAG: hypothetical protein WC655_05730 [Candidatus Hydrogenedentales bacterium]